MAIRPYLMSGVALASATAIVAAMPAADFSRDVEVQAASPAPARTMTVEQIRLLQVTLQGLFEAFFNGYGGIVTGDEDGNCAAEDAVCSFGPVGVAYYLGDQTIFAGIDLDNQIFETGLGFIIGDEPLLPLTQPLIPITQPLIPITEPLLPASIDPGGAVIDLIIEASGLFGTTVQGAVDAYFNGYTDPVTDVESAGWIASLNYLVDNVGGLPFAAADAEETVALLSETPVEEVEESTEETNPGFARLGTGRFVDVATNSLDGSFFGRNADPAGPAAQATITGTEPETEVIEAEPEGEESGENGRGIVRNGLSFSPGGSRGVLPFEEGSGAGAGGGWNPLGAIADGVRDAVNGGGGFGGGGFGGDDDGGDDDGDGGDDGGNE